MRRDGRKVKCNVGGIIFQGQSVGKLSIWGRREGGGALRRKGRSERGPTGPFLICECDLDAEEKPQNVEQMHLNASFSGATDQSGSLLAGLL